LLSFVRFGLCSRLFGFGFLRRHVAVGVRLRLLSLPFSLHGIVACHGTCRFFGSPFDVFDYPADAGFGTCVRHKNLLALVASSDL